MLPRATCNTVIKFGSAFPSWPPGWVGAHPPQMLMLPGQGQGSGLDRMLERVGSKHHVKQINLYIVARPDAG